MDERQQATLLSILLDKSQSNKLNPSSCLPDRTLAGSNKAVPRPNTSAKHQPNHLELQCHPDSHSAELALQLSTNPFELIPVLDSSSDLGHRRTLVDSRSSSSEMSSRAAVMAIESRADTSTPKAVKQPLTTPQPPRIPGFNPNKYGNPMATRGTSQVAAAPTQSPSTPSLPFHSGIHSSTATHSTIDDSTLATTPQQLEASASSTFQTTCSEPESRCFSEPQAPGAADFAVHTPTETEVEPTLHPSTVLNQAAGANPHPKLLYVQIEAQVKSESLISNPNLSGAQLVKPHSRSWAQSHLPQLQGRPRGPLTPASTNKMNSLIQGRGQKPRQQTTTDTPTSTFNGSETRMERLRRLQVQQVSEIHRRNRRRDRDETASPATLAALRLPLSPDKEQKVAERVSHYQDFQRQASQLQSLDPDLTTPEDPPMLQQDSTLKHITQTPILTRTSPQKVPITNSKPSSKDTIDYYVPPHARGTEAKRNPRWVSNADIKPQRASTDSNAWGSMDSNLAAVDSDDSVVAINAADSRHGKGPVAPDTLIQWDGKMQPPPIDWADRPRFNNKNPEFREAFNQWGEAVLEGPALNANFQALDDAQINDISLHPDGIGMVPRKTTITPTNAARYGYSLDHKDTEEKRTTWDCQPLTDDELRRSTIVDKSDPQNEPILQETSEHIVQRYLAHHNIDFNSVVRNEALETKAPEGQSKKPTKPQKESHPNAPKVAIYIRPAVKTDLPQMLDIYNWHVENGPRTTEFSAATQEDMRGRLDHVETSKLPLIVAVAKATRRNRYKQAEVVTAKVEKKATSSSTDSDSNGAIRTERILGWASAQDWTSQDFVERTSVEVEIYVDPKSQRLGVGRCLLDKLLEACDRGYLKKGGYDFNCAPERRHLYISGGGRDLHKLYFILRTWNRPQKRSKGKSVEEELVLHQEDDYEIWLKAWLERNGFEVEGRLKKAGAKNGRL
jgi:L-amino acid N-acyltransferase YncA